MHLNESAFMHSITPAMNVNAAERNKSASHCSPSLLSSSDCCPLHLQAVAPCFVLFVVVIVLFYPKLRIHVCSFVLETKLLCTISERVFSLLSFLNFVNGDSAVLCSPGWPGAVMQPRLTSNTWQPSFLMFLNVGITNALPLLNASCFLYDLLYVFWKFFLIFITHLNYFI